MIRILASGGIAALALLVVLATAVQPTGVVRCGMSHELMSAACCVAIAPTPAVTPPAIGSPCCCEVIALPPAVLTTTERLAGKYTEAHAPHHWSFARREHHRMGAMRLHVRAALTTSASTVSSRPAYERYCTYLL